MGTKLAWELDNLPYILCREKLRLRSLTCYLVSTSRKPWQGSSGRVRSTITAHMIVSWTIVKKLVADLWLVFAWMVTYVIVKIWYMYIRVNLFLHVVSCVIQDHSSVAEAEQSWRCTIYCSKDVMEMEMKLRNSRVIPTRSYILCISLVWHLNNYALLLHIYHNNDFSL